MTRRCLAVLVSCVTAILSGPASAAAQGTYSRSVAVDTVIGVQDIFRETRDWPTQVVADTFVSVQPTPGVQVSLRPVLWRVGGEWEALLDQASVQYEFQHGTNWRIEAGRFASPMGLGMTENRASLNPGVLWCHRPYYMPLPGFGPGAPRVSLVSAVYPTGVHVATSADHWDARVAVVDKAPVRFWYDDPVDRHANVIVGGGVTPRQGLRVGVAAARGTVTGSFDVPYRMVNVEASYTVGYTRVSGEWTRDTFDLPGSTAVSRGVTAQVEHTLSPRLFVHARATILTSPEILLAGPVDRTFRSLDTTVGYRLDPDVTLRVGYNALRGFGASAVDHQVDVSLMWTRRWW